MKFDFDQFLIQSLPIFTKNYLNWPIFNYFVIKSIIWDTASNEKKIIL